MKLLIFLFAVLVRLSAVGADELVHAFDFTTQPKGSAISWLKEQGFEFKLAFEALNPRFEKGALWLSTQRPEAGLCGVTFAKGSDLQQVKRLRLTWGVEEFPEGADWERGINRTPLAVMVSFGYERLSSGLPFGIQAAPYFISPFIGAREAEGKAYTGKFWKLGGRYICVKRGKAGETMVSELAIDHLFQTLFSKSPTPAISAVGIQMNTKDTGGPAAAFIKKIEFLRER
jgi:hypothetical protein